MCNCWTLSVRGGSCDNHLKGTSESLITGSRVGSTGVYRTSVRELRERPHLPRGRSAETTKLNEPPSRIFDDLWMNGHEATSPCFHALMSPRNTDAEASEAARTCEPSHSLPGGSIQYNTLRPAFWSNQRPRTEILPVEVARASNPTSSHHSYHQNVLVACTLVLRTKIEHPDIEEHMR